MARTVKAKFVIAGTIQEYDDYVDKKIHLFGMYAHDFIEISSVQILDHAAEDSFLPITGVFIGTYKARIDLLDITRKIKELNKWPLTKELFPGEKELWRQKWLNMFKSEKHIGTNVGDYQYNPYTDENYIMTNQGLKLITAPVTLEEVYADDGGTGASW